VRDSAIARVAVGVQENAEQAGAGNSIGQTVMHARDQGATSAAEAVDQEQVPQRLAAVHHAAEDFPGEGPESGLRAAPEMFREYMIADVEVGVGLPGRMADMKRRNH